MLGGWEKRVEPNEIKNAYVQRRSLYAKNDLRRGTVLKPNDIAALRPYSGEGFSPMDVEKLIGKTLIQDIMKNELITNEAVF